MLNNSLRLAKNRRELYQAKLVFYYFIASLAMFFLAMLVSYCVIRTQAFQPIQREYEPLTIPASFWISTVLLVFSSLFLQRGVWLIRRQRLNEFRRAMLIGLGFVLGFVAIQSVGMHQWWEQHFAADDGSTKAYGMSFVLAFLHILHVLGGMVFLVYVIVQAQRGRYDHERHWAVEHCAGYWHFLHVVWFVMLIAFLITN